MPPLFDDLQKVTWLARILGEARTASLIADHFASIRRGLTSKDVRHLYDARYLELIAGHPVALTVSDVFPVNIYQAPVLRRVLSSFPQHTETVLDIGCGGGNFLMALASLGFRCFGVDYDSEAVRTAQSAAESNRARFPSGVPQIHLSDVDDIALPGPFDLITLNDVVEHLSDVELLRLLRASRSRLDAGGILLLHTPNGRCFYNWTERTLKGRLVNLAVRALGHRVRKSLEEVYYEQVHINVMGPTNLEQIAQRAGFSSVEITYDDPYRIEWLTDLFSGSFTAVLRG